MIKPIEFRTYPEYKGIIPDVAPARKFIPEWYKNMAPHSKDVGDNETSSTVKRCVPFLDAMMLGYVIPLWADFHCETDETSAKITSKWNDLVHPHKASQIAGSPFGDSQFGKNPLKFNSPWLIRTEPGWSVLITAPFNHGDAPFHILTGIIDTDNYKSFVNFPFVWTQPNFKGVVPRGTPIAQVIPFKREELATEAIIDTLTEEDFLNERRVKASLASSMIHAYKQEHWEKKFNK